MKEKQIDFSVYNNIIIETDGIKYKFLLKEKYIYWEDIIFFGYENNLFYIIIDKKKNKLKISKDKKKLITEIYDRYLSILTTKEVGNSFEYSDHLKKNIYFHYIGKPIIAVFIFYYFYKIIYTLYTSVSKFPNLSNQFITIELILIFGFISFVLIIVSGLFDTRYKHHWFSKISIDNEGLNYIKNATKKKIKSDEIDYFDDSITNPVITIGYKVLCISRLKNWPIFLELLKTNLNWDKTKNSLADKKEKLSLKKIYYRCILYALAGAIIYYYIILPVFNH